MASKYKSVVAGGIAIGTAAFAGNFLLADGQSSNKSVVLASEVNLKKKLRRFPTRAEQLESLKTEEFDVLVIGGGATGAGCALDATSRGLKTALVEADDFSSGTSSRSTKLIHGGVRYLQKALMGLDYQQYKMVREALHERANFLAVAPHLAEPLPIMLPAYAWWKVPYFWFGMKMYDVLSWSKCVRSSHYISKEMALEYFPMLKKENLRGAIVYYDGQMNDARVNLALVLTATRHGATVANHVRVTSLLKDANGKVCGARMRDEMSGGKEWEVKAKCVINATGPFTDAIRKMDDPQVKEICSPSSGVHIVLPDYYSPAKMGLLDPDTKDDRFLFFLPWEKHTIAGTTDDPCKVSENPAPTEEDVQFILSEIKRYLSPDVEVRRGDVLSAWSGIRPLVSDPNKPNTQSLARNHIVHVSKSGLVTIAGGKWTTYRSMAVDTLDEAVKSCGLKPEYVKSQTDGLFLEGGRGWTPTMYITLVQDFGLESEVAQHLANTYGDRAFAVAKLASMTGQRWPIIGKRLHPDFPYIDAEVRYAVKEYACTAIDVIARRLRLAFLNVQAAQEALPMIIDIMGEELGWSAKETKAQYESALTFLNEQMGQGLNRACRHSNIPIKLSSEERKIYEKKFASLDSGKKGYISLNDVRMALRRAGEDIPGEQLHQILKAIDGNTNGLIELHEYLQLMSAIKNGVLQDPRLVSNEK
ncbi:glycerol-3-phosphate dehydrogenase, mitochondrial-like [Neocloeon triangulifer]|uniref:glycerol-3-phosphate dehydrogenase, mitochondrial-like n=1 Tax=Neocloeon triangulifer TaxID=2078957 RepID=UPI00286F1FAA|nr:glycerol-3-phosphate dehydrogenase, mitochondrial-like [Neocloeon triangulifer]